MLQPIFAHTGNNFISILVVFGDLSEKSKKSCGDESFEIVQYFLFFSTSFSLKLLFKFFFITEYAFALSPLFSYALVARFCIAEYAEIVPTVNKVNAEQYKMKLTW